MLEHDDLEVHWFTLTSFLNRMFDFIVMCLSTDTIVRQWHAVQSPLLPSTQGRSEENGDVKVIKNKERLLNITFYPGYGGDATLRTEI